MAPDTLRPLRWWPVAVARHLVWLVDYHMKPSRPSAARAELGDGRPRAEPPAAGNR